MVHVCDPNVDRLQPLDHQGQDESRAHFEVKKPPKHSVHKT